MRTPLYAVRTRTEAEEGGTIWHASGSDEAACRAMRTGGASTAPFDIPGGRVSEQRVLYAARFRSSTKRLQRTHQLRHRNVTVEQASAMTREKCSTSPQLRREDPERRSANPRGPLRGTYHRELVNDPERCEYFVAIEWLQTVPVEQAVQEVGFVGNQNTVCKPT
jgi:hypothetical protein